MTRISLAALVLALGAGAAYAQTSEPSHAPSGPDGTVGAMQAVVQGLTTSADDVVAQQEGRSTAVGARPLGGSPTANATGYAPGTIGAAPGNDAPR